MPSKLFKRTFKNTQLNSDLIATAIDLASDYLYDWIYQNLGDDLLRFSADAEVYTTDEAITIILRLVLEISPLSPKVKAESDFLEAAANEFFRHFEDTLKKHTETN